MSGRRTVGQDEILFSFSRFYFILLRVCVCVCVSYMISLVSLLAMHWILLYSMLFPVCFGFVLRHLVVRRCTLSPMKKHTRDFSVFISTIQKVTST